MLYLTALHQACEQMHELQLFCLTTLQCVCAGLQCAGMRVFLPDMLRLGLQRAAAERLEAGLRELEIMRVELSASRQNVDKAEYDKAKVCGLTC